MTAPAAAHAALMDQVYRRQKYIYDATRKFFLFGRDHLIATLDPPPRARVLELGCGTGRNLAAIARAWPGCRLYGLDISHEMLGIAARRLGPAARLGAGDATAFDPAAVFGCTTFDRVVISYALSMIPAWEAVIAQAIAVTAPGGSVHIVDFGDLAGLWRPLAALLRRWLAHFHVEPRAMLLPASTALAQARSRRIVAHDGPLGYYRMVTLTRGV